MLQSGIIELDVHSMNRAQAKTYIDSQLKRAKKDIYQIKVIHGYRIEVVLQSGIWSAKLIGIIRRLCAWNCH